MAVSVLIRIATSKMTPNGELNGSDRIKSRVSRQRTIMAVVMHTRVASLVYSPSNSSPPSHVSLERSQPAAADIPSPYTSATGAEPEPAEPSTFTQHAMRLSRRPKSSPFDSTPHRGGLILGPGPGRRAVGRTGGRSHCGRIFSFPCWPSYCVHGRAAEGFGCAPPPPAAAPKSITQVGPRVWPLKEKSRQTAAAVLDRNATVTGVVTANIRA
ncbi:hypothetical protein LY76DRAFT_639326 [Colletotrichum caudatum]|nr:hypothetical protein LY76DRAFT_639326 [Colletotrichum caudatum]